MIIYYLFQSSDLIVYLKEQLDSKEKELFVVVSKEVEEKQLWMHQYTVNNHRQETMSNHRESDQDCDSSVNAEYEYKNRDADCLRVMEVRNCVISRDEF